ncbi:MAG: hypothetical protein HZB91_03120 [Elusimicrobia bacterium]|nr:hypothetical protein [Elusimicrobiota bacterium]
MTTFVPIRRSPSAALMTMDRSRAIIAASAPIMRMTCPMAAPVTRRMLVPAGAVSPAAVGTMTSAAARTVASAAARTMASAAARTMASAA